MIRALLASAALQLASLLPVVALILLASPLDGCHPGPPQPVPVASGSACDFGDMGSAPTNADLCPGLWVSGYQCVRCAGASECVDARHQVWCVSACSQCYASHGAAQR